MRVRYEVCAERGTDYLYGLHVHARKHHFRATVALRPGTKLPFSPDDDARRSGATPTSPDEVPWNANVGWMLAGETAVLDIDEPCHENVPTYLRMVGLERLINYRRVWTPNGVHVYLGRMHMIRRGRWKLKGIPAVLIAGHGYVVAPGSIVDEKMYIYDPTQTEEVSERELTSSFFSDFLEPDAHDATFT